MKNLSNSQPSGPRDTSHPDNAVAQGSAPARSGASRADGGRTGAKPSGIESSNTIPYNCNGETFKALRWGVDSLYLSYAGELLPEVLTRLKALKDMAQGKDPEQQALAQYPLGGHTFEVKDRGTGLFPYILEDGAFRIQLSKGGKVPVAYAKVSAGYLAHVGPREAERRLHALLVELARLDTRAMVSRIDLFCDFVWTGPFDWDRSAWVTRAAGIDAFSENGTFTGWMIGRGGVILARLYYKSLQALKTGQDYLVPLWRQAGRADDEPVWRLEFQFKRDMLVQMGLGPLDSTLTHLDGLWSYATTEWLKLTIPQATDRTRSRWPIHGLWGYLSAIDWNGPGGPLSRDFDTTRAPRDQRLYALYMAGLLGYMAKRQIHDLYQAQEAMTAEVVAYYMGKAYLDGIAFERYIQERVALKVRQYGTALNDPDALDDLDQAEVDAQAAAYRKASRGG